MQHDGGVCVSGLKTTRLVIVASVKLVTVASIISEPSMNDTESWYGLDLRMREARCFSIAGGTGELLSIAFFFVKPFSLRLYHV